MDTLAHQIGGSCPTAQRGRRRCRRAAASGAPESAGGRTARFARAVYRASFVPAHGSLGLRMAPAHGRCRSEFCRQRLGRRAVLLTPRVSVPCAPRPGGRCRGGDGLDSCRPAAAVSEAANCALEAADCVLEAADCVLEAANSAGRQRSRRGRPRPTRMRTRRRRAHEGVWAEGRSWDEWPELGRNRGGGSEKAGAWGLGALGRRRPPARALGKARLASGGGRHGGGKGRRRPPPAVVAPP